MISSLKEKGALRVRRPGIEWISIVLPIFNEEAIIERVVKSCLEYLAQVDYEWELIAVDDGSQDRTKEILYEIARHKEPIKVVSYTVNRGYGGALRAGFDKATKELLFFMDADGQFLLKDIELLLARYTSSTPVVVGCRRKRVDSFHRRFNAWAWGFLVRMLFAIPVRDINCAFKLFPTELVRSLALFSQGANINTEILAKLGKIGIRPIEIEVAHYPRLKGKSTGANPRVVVRAFLELYSLWKILRKGRLIS